MRCSVSSLTGFPVLACQEVVREAVVVIAVSRSLVPHPALAAPGMTPALRGSRAPGRTSDPGRPPLRALLHAQYNRIARRSASAPTGGKEHMCWSDGANGVLSGSFIGSTTRVGRVSRDGHGLP